MIELKEVTENDADFLFELYQSRESFNLIEPIKHEDQQSFVNSYVQKQDSKNDAYKVFYTRFGRKDTVNVVSRYSHSDTNETKT